jgi:hypothetical protein
MLFLFGGFMLFNFMINIGPNAQTYLIAREVFLTRIRVKGAGFAASLREDRRRDPPSCADERCQRRRHETG